MVLTRCVALLASIWLTMLTSRASADVWSIAPRVTDHTGPFLRMAVGVSALRLQSSSGENTRLRGPGLLYDFAIGWSVAPAIAAHLSGFGGFAFAPRLARDDRESRSHDEATIRLHGLGVGATFHLPLNIYVSPALGVGLAAEIDVTRSMPKRDRFDAGLASALDIGWEFWISPQGGPRRRCQGGVLLSARRRRHARAHLAWARRRAAVYHHVQLTKGLS